MSKKTLTFAQWKSEYWKIMVARGIGASAPDEFLLNFFVAGVTPDLMTDLSLGFQEMVGFDPNADQPPQDPTLPLQPPARVIKTKFERGDLTAAGKKGTVKGGKRFYGNYIIYFVQWDGDEIINGVKAESIKEIR